MRQQLKVLSSQPHVVLNPSSTVASAIASSVKDAEELVFS